MKRSRKQGKINPVIKLEIERRRRGEQTPRVQTFLYHTQSEGDTVASALLFLNAQAELLDADGNPAEPVQWECSCLQKRCGACAMLVNGHPQLACDSFLRDLPDTVRLAPLRKFPVVADLQIDRSVMQKNLLETHQWMEHEAVFDEEQSERAYAASRCLQCGLCLEVCPNFDPAGGFTGAAAAVPAARVLAADAAPEDTALVREYRWRVFEGCGKSLACRNICPAGIDIGEMLAQSNAVAVWKRRRKRKNRRRSIQS